MRSNSRCKIGKIGMPGTYTFIRRVAFLNRLENRNADGRIKREGDSPTSVTNLVIFDPVTPEFTRS